MCRAAGARHADAVLAGHARLTIARAAARNAALADAVEQVRRHPALEERLVGEQRLVDRDVRDEALDDQLVERDPRRGRSPPRGSGPQTMSLPSSES